MINGFLNALALIDEWLLKKLAFSKYALCKGQERATLKLEI